MEDEKCILIGGPLDGKVVFVSPGVDRYQAPNVNRRIKVFDSASGFSRLCFVACSYERVHENLFRYCVPEVQS